MLEGRIIMLGAMCAGTILGSLFALSVPTAMKPPPESHWRESLPQPQFSSVSYRFVEAGPIDGGPHRWLEPPIPYSEPLPDYTVPDNAAELEEVMAEPEPEPAAIEFAETAPAPAPDEAVVEPQVQVQVPEPILVTLPEVPGFTS